ncbi:MAG TPA: TIGR00270 family protein [Pyrodictiaceae archaeon]|nr:TIGR00270 family protein [Pyrodictiaceae archaeon]HIP85688.1 TIGR00270 family protein [Pyrodictium sp.]HIQ11187.1 TIGR00270 family protein [Pyrodictium sp.]HIQ55678.1 TIGR00270 family protein [Pyrodictium sp.]
MCGRPITTQSYRITVEGIELVVCGACYRRYMSRVQSTALDTPTRLRLMQPTQRLEVVREQVVTSSYTRVGELKNEERRQTKPITTGSRTTQIRKRSSRLGVYEKFEVVPDYAERVKRARERLGWTQRMLAQKAKVSENVIKRIEAGTLTPSIDLAKRLEKILGIKLLEPVVEEEEGYSGEKGRFYLTLGDIAEIKED